LHAKLYKCEFWLGEVSFLGHVIFSGGIVVDPSKVDIVLQWETPKSVTEIRSFILCLSDDGLVTLVTFYIGDNGFFIVPF
jgi:hypothetical protein